MVVAHSLGFPRIGANRELKKAVESYWQKAISKDDLVQEGKRLRRLHWELQAKAGMDLLPVNDFSFYDHVLDMSALLGVVPSRFGAVNGQVDLDTYFRMGRGRAPTGADTTACEMTKWFDTNYHYMVPEFAENQAFALKSNKLFDEVDEAVALGYQAKPVVLGPLSYLYLGKAIGDFDKLKLLPGLVRAYGEILQRLAQKGIAWVQIDEPILVMDLPQSYKDGFASAYATLAGPASPKLLLTTYFGGVGDNLELVCKLPVQGLHVDGVRGKNELVQVAEHLPRDKVLSVGMVDGRNIWRCELEPAFSALAPLHARFGDNLWVSSSCSLLHSPVDLANEKNMDREIKPWLSFAAQKVLEIATLKKGLSLGAGAIAHELEESMRLMEAKASSPRIHNAEVKKRLSQVTDNSARRANAFAERRGRQHEKLRLPMFPTTTIGSFPQTKEIRQLRADLKSNKITQDTYEQQIRGQIALAVKKQEELGLDVLVHGEAERNDMVEYFGEQLNGFMFTQNGWVQSYGSRCVKPPVIYGDVSRPQAMTTEWSAYAQSLTQRPMKGMLTGPVTILCWSFVRDDQPRMETARQIALALRDEVVDLEKAGISVIQIDEPAFREGLPLRRAAWDDYLKDATHSFRLASCGVRDETQIHTHMCYAEFNDIIGSIADLDADVITMETSRSNMELLKAFETFAYPNEIGPGVYDIHSPRIPSSDEMVLLMQKAAERIAPDYLWVNPDCGLKTRGWPEVERALNNMVTAAKTLRQKYA